MAAKLRRWLREAAVFLALLIAIMVVMDVWRAPQAPPAFCRDTVTYADGRVDNSGDLERRTPRTALFLGQLVRGMPLYYACGRSPGG